MVRDTYDFKWSLDPGMKLQIKYQTGHFRDGAKLRAARAEGRAYIDLDNLYANRWASNFVTGEWYV